MAVSVGQQAPDFSLFTDDKAAFVLSKERGKRAVVLLFFPGAFTSVCATELNTVNNELDGYGEDVAVLGISTDSPFSLAEFRKVNGFGFNLLSDHNAEVSELYGAKYRNDFTPMKLDRISKRAAFVIDKEGVVKYAEVLENAGQLPDLEAVKKVASSLG